MKLFTGLKRHASSCDLSPVNAASPNGFAANNPYAPAHAIARDANSTDDP